MNAEKVIKRDNDYVAHTYGRSDLVIESGHGMTAVDADGKEYLDFTSGIGVTSMGYCDPDWVAAVEKQLHKLQHTSNLYYTAPCGKLAKKLCQMSGMDKVFFGNSGAEANEGAIKAARKYSVDKYGEGRYNVVTLVNSFHGRTIATLTATGQDVFHNSFGPFNEGFRYVPANDFEALKAAMEDGTVCAVLFECVQGEGGVMALDVQFVHNMVNYCRKHDVLLVADEVQTGVGRTGTFLACEHYGFTPDVATLAKGLGGGLPIGAVLMKDAVAEHMGPGSHGSTFGGNPVVCAGALAVLEKMDFDFMHRLSDRAAQLRSGLEKLPHVEAVTGLGLMVGIQLADGISAAAVRNACQEKGLLVLTAKTRLRMLPPLVLTAQDVDNALAILGDVLANWKTEE